MLKLPILQKSIGPQNYDQEERRGDKDVKDCETSSIGDLKHCMKFQDRDIWRHVTSSLRDGYRT